jgi:hypothetical protein
LNVVVPDFLNSSSDIWPSQHFKAQAPAQQKRRKSMSFTGNRFGQSFDNDENATSSNKKRSKEVRLRLKELGQFYKAAQIETARLLEECRAGGYWAEEYATFSDFVEKEVGISLRTAQEMMRVIRKCNVAKVSPEKIAELGWSKVALIAKDLNEENAAKLLAEVKDKSYSQLQESTRQKRKSKNAVKGKSYSKVDKNEQSDICISESVLAALQCASLHTRDFSTQANLEFMAAKFIELCPPPSRVPENQNWN